MRAFLIVASLVAYSIPLTLSGCVRVQLTAAGAPTTTQEKYDDLKAAESMCRRRSARTIECLIDAPTHRSRVRFLAGVDSTDDVRPLRSGRICAALSRGGVKCLGVDMIRAIESRNVSSRRAFLWDDGYCVQERSRERIRCEWFGPKYELDRRVLFLNLPGEVQFVAFPAGMCACSAAIDRPRRGMSTAPSMAVCLRTKEPARQDSYARTGERLVFSDALDVVHFYATERGQDIGVCSEIKSDPSKVDEIVPRLSL